MQQIRNMNWTMAVVGVWVTIAPFLLHYGNVTTALWNDLVVGPAVCVLAVAAALSPDEDRIRTLDWITAVAGLWLVLAPFILGYSSVGVALWNDIIAGVIILAISVGAERELPQVVRQAS